MLNRRAFLMTTSAAALALQCFRPSLAFAAAPMLTRKIPRTGELLPVIGMGTSGSFEVGSDATERAPLAEVLKTFIAGGGRLIDTAPSYGTAESVLGELIEAGGHRESIFLATKLSSRSRDDGLAQFNASLKRLRTDRVELLQVHNLLDWRTQLALARELQAEGKVRYVGLTHYVDSAHDALAEAVSESKPDFLQINYSVTQRAAEKRVLPLAKDLGVAVLANRNFDDGALFAKVGDQTLPGWADAVGAQTWSQLFLKFVLSNEAVNVVIPATSKPHRQAENLLAGSAPLLNSTQRAELIDICT